MVYESMKILPKTQKLKCKFHFINILLLAVIITIKINMIVSPVPECRGDEVGERNSKIISKTLIPIYPGAINVKHYSLKNGLIKGVSYKVKLPYPSKDVLDFYDKEMSKRGYKPFVEEYYKYVDRKWQFLEDVTKKDKLYVSQLIADWVDSNRKRRVVLVLRYYWHLKMKEHNRSILEVEDVQHVIFQIMPFVIIPPPQNE